jgi:diadenosine tetraphosphatase ApaH/serine/threonine PP2A family protein phosphatase
VGIAPGLGRPCGVRYAILSDVHANLESLEVALARLAPADGVLCLGDIVGYGPNPNECVAKIRERASETVLGNHDVAAVDNFGLEYFNQAARAAIVWTQSVLAKPNAEWLSGLGYELRRPDYLMVHGAPVDYFAYILDNVDAARAFAATDAPLIFVGHSHIAEYYAQHLDGRIAHRHMQHGGRLTLEQGVRYIVNVGSVGQPRDANPEASFAFYDPQAATVTWDRYAYDVARVQEKILAAHLPESLSRRLALGR